MKLTKYCEERFEVINQLIKDRPHFTKEWKQLENQIKELHYAVRQLYDD